MRVKDLEWKDEYIYGVAVQTGRILGLKYQVGWDPRKETWSVFRDDEGIIGQFIGSHPEIEKAKEIARFNAECRIRAVWITEEKTTQEIYDDTVEKHVNEFITPLLNKLIADGLPTDSPLISAIDCMGPSCFYDDLANEDQLKGVEMALEWIAPHFTYKGEEPSND